MSKFSYTPILKFHAIIVNSIKNVKLAWYDYDRTVFAHNTESLTPTTPQKFNLGSLFVGQADPITSL